MTQKDNYDDAECLFVRVSTTAVVSCFSCAQKCLYLGVGIFGADHIGDSVEV